MAYVSTTHNSDAMLSHSIPFMDRLTHSIIKETSKNLKHYLDVKRRENGFVLSPSASSVDATPQKARFMYGTTKEYPPLYGSYHSDNDVKTYLRSIHQHQRASYSSSNTVDQQVCREELHFHMRPPRFSPRENQQFSKLQLRATRRSNSSCSGQPNRSDRQGLSKSTSDERDALIDDTANILAGLVKARRTIHTANLLSRQPTPTYVSRNANPSPRQTDDPSTTIPTLPPTDPNSDRRRSTDVAQPKKTKRTTENTLARAASIMQKAQPITKNIHCDYKLTVITGNCNGASTNAPISIKLYGTKGCTTFLNLLESETHKVPFLKDQTDVFKVNTFHVGRLVGITIGHDRQDMRASWFLSKVIIEDPIRKRTFHIPCNAWLSSKSNDQKTMRDFQVTSMESQRGNSRLSNRGREDTGSQSDYSTTTNEGTIRSDSTIRSQHSRSTDGRRKKKSRPPMTSTKEKSSKLSSKPRSRSSSPPVSQHQSYDHTDKSSSSQVTKRRIRSPEIARSPSSDSDSTIREKGIHQSHPTTPTSDSPRVRSSLVKMKTTTHETMDDHSSNDERPPARLEKRTPSPERTKKGDYEEDFDEDFFN